MSRRSRRTTIWPLAAVAALAFAGCGQLNRGATLNQVTVTSGATAAAAVQQALAAHGFPNAKVSCVKKLIVNVGTGTTCALTGANGHALVSFTFTDKDGKVKLSSVHAIS